MKLFFAENGRNVRRLTPEARIVEKHTAAAAKTLYTVAAAARIFNSESCKLTPNVAAVVRSQSQIICLRVLWFAVVAINTSVCSYSAYRRNVS